MRRSDIEPVFENRYDAGRKLAEKLTGYSGESAVVLGIPNGGVAVALGVALAIGADFDLVNTTVWGAGLDHFTVDDANEVTSGLIDQLILQMAP